MSIDASPYSIRTPGGHVIPHGVAVRLVAPVWRDGLEEPVTACVARLYDPSGALRQDGGDVVGAQAVLDVLAASTSTHPRGAGWRVEWDITVDAGVLRPQIDAVVTRRQLYPVVTPGDLIGRHGMLDRDSARPATASTLQDHIDEAWRVIMDRIKGRGDLPDLVMSPSSLREVHLYMALELAFADIAGDNAGSGYTDREGMYAQKAMDAWSALTWVVDANDDGVPDANAKRQAPPRQVWLA